MFEDFFHQYWKEKWQESDSYDERYPFKGSSLCFSVLNPHRGTRDFMSKISVNHASMPNWCDYLCKLHQTDWSIFDLSMKCQRVHDSNQQNNIKTIVFNNDNNPIIDSYLLSRSNENDNKTSPSLQLVKPSNLCGREDYATKVLHPVQLLIQVTCKLPVWNDSHKSKVCEPTVWPHCTTLDVNYNYLQTTSVMNNVLE